jgi:hypothetical protein
MIHPSFSMIYKAYIIAGIAFYKKKYPLSKGFWIREKSLLRRRSIARLFSICKKNHKPPGEEKY